jgi:hypothetical protein
MQGERRSGLLTAPDTDIGRLCFHFHSGGHPRPFHLCGENSSLEMLLSHHVKE